MNRKIVTAIILFGGLNAAIASAKPKTAKASDNFQTILSSNFDFNETAISGEMKAPDGFFLQGRKSQSLSQMVKLRADFRKQLLQSKTGVKAFIK